MVWEPGGATVEERVSALEGRMTDHVQVLNGIRDAIASLDGRVSSFEARMDARLLASEERMDRRFEQVDRRFEQMERRFEQMDHRFDRIDERFDQSNQRFVTMSEQMSRQFVWIVGIGVTTLASALTTIGAIAAAMLTR